MTVLFLCALACGTLTEEMTVPPGVADSIFGRANATFCDEMPHLIDMTSPFFPFVALAQVERDVGGGELLALLEEAERHEEDFARRYKPRRITLPRTARRAVIRSAETERVAGCYAELSPLIDNPYRSGESGAFVRIFRGGAIGRSGSTAYWLAVNSDGSVARLVPLPLFVD
jgi:hypothetical protein